MARPFLIGITGKARAGKDTAADLLLKRYPGVKRSFARVLKEMTAPLNLPEDIDKDSVIPHLGVSRRQIWQTLGTDWGRKLNPDLWVILEDHAIQQMYPQPPMVVFADVRFDNEAHYIRENGGLVLEVTRSTAPEVQQHESEAGITHNLIAATIQNEGSFEQLEDQLLTKLKQLKQ